MQRTGELALLARRPLTAAFAPRAALEAGDNRLYTHPVRIEWDPPKARANLRAHGIGFAEAATALEDDFALTREDPGADDEPQFVTLGLSMLGTCWWSCTCIENLTRFE